MAINSLAFNSRLTQELDKALVQKSVTGFMVDNSMRQKFVGAKTVLIPDIDLQGLGDYDRDEGFVRGTVTVAHTPFTLSQDRARTFSIDREDMDEIGIANLVGQVMNEFVRTEVVPEVDAYVLSKLCGIATGADTPQTVTLGSGETLPNSSVKLLNKAIDAVRNATGYDEELVAFLDPTVYSALMSTNELTRLIEISDFKKGEVSTQVKKYNDVALIPVPAARMRTSYIFYDGTTSGETAGGFVPTPASGSGEGAVPAAGHIGMLILPKRAGMLIKKTEKVRIFSPDQNQNMDAYKFDYRLYYDALVKKSLTPSIYAYTYADA